MLGSWKLHSSLKEQIKNIKNIDPQPKQHPSKPPANADLPQKAATGWL